MHISQPVLVTSFPVVADMLIGQKRHVVTFRKPRPTRNANYQQSLASCESLYLFGTIHGKYSYSHNGPLFFLQFHIFQTLLPYESYRTPIH